MKIIPDLTATGMRAALSGGFVPPDPVAPAAAGGTETVIVQGEKFYRVHTFLSSGTLTVTNPGAFEALLVAGGGPGGSVGSGIISTAGGGSAGDVILQIVTLAVGTHTVTVGLGGVSTNDATASPGDDTIGLGLTARGGGPGGARLVLPADGGGGDLVNTSGAAHPTSFAGRDAAGDGPNRAGGGGRGSAGDGQNGNGSNGNGGDGGAATSNDINGTATDYGRGGGGGGRQIGGAPNGATVTGDGQPGVNPGDGGGGATSQFGDPQRTGGPGANGIVIVRYEITQEEYDGAL